MQQPHLETQGDVCRVLCKSVSKETTSWSYSSYTKPLFFIICYTWL